MRVSTGFLRVLCGAVFAFTCAPVPGQLEKLAKDLPEAVLWKGYAYTLLPASVLPVVGIYSDHAMQDDGDALALVTYEPDEEALRADPWTKAVAARHVYYWKPGSPPAEVVQLGPDREVAALEFSGDSLFVTVSPTVRDKDGRNAARMEVYGTTGGPSVRICAVAASQDAPGFSVGMAAPRGGIYVLFSKVQHKASAFDADGKLFGTFETTGMEFPNFDETGTKLVVGEGTTQRGIDLRTGQVSDLANERTWEWMPKPAASFGLTKVKASQFRTTAKSNAAWYSPLPPNSDDPSLPPMEEWTVLCASLDADVAQISGSADYVFYVHRGIPIIREIVKVPQDVYRKRRNAALKDAALNAAKNVALAQLMYAGDYDDFFPTASMKLDAVVRPYVKDPTMFDVWVRTFFSTVLPIGANPASVQLGYVWGPDGYAVAFADGHVEYISGPGRP